MTDDDRPKLGFKEFFGVREAYIFRWTESLKKGLKKITELKKVLKKIMKLKKVLKKVNSLKKALKKVMN